MDNYQRTRRVALTFEPDRFAIPSGRRAIEKPFRIGIGHIHAAVTHRMTKIVVPVRTMKAIILIKILHPLDAW